MLSAKQGSIKNCFYVFGMTRPGIESRSTELLESTVPTILMGRYIYIYIEREREAERDRERETGRER